MDRRRCSKETDRSGSHNQGTRASYPSSNRFRPISSVPRDSCRFGRSRTAQIKLFGKRQQTPGGHGEVIVEPAICVRPARGAPKIPTILAKITEAGEAALTMPARFSQINRHGLAHGRPPTRRERRRPRYRRSHGQGLSELGGLMRLQLRPANSGYRNHICHRTELE
jgi:hypothetical protein